MKKLVILPVLALVVGLMSLVGGVAYADDEVTCASQTGGTINADIIVPTGSGPCTLVGVTVNGDIELGHSGVQLFVQGNSTINGDIESPGGTVRIKNSIVNGDIEVENCGGAIKVEDSEVNGDVELEDNGTVIFTGNTVNGDAEFEGNGTLDLSGTTFNGDLEVSP